jgi:fluoride ion exporter CrcB/FEX
MSAFAISGITFVCIAAGALLGMALRYTLPDHHLNADAKDVVRLGTGVIGTIAALVLGLLIASAKSSYDTPRPVRPGDGTPAAICYDVAS